MKVELNQKELEQAIIDQAVDTIVGSDEDIYSRIEGAITSRVNKLFESTVDSKVDELLTKVMEETLDKEIQPVDIWGERDGKPTTIRASLHEKSKNFWTEKVDSKGKPSKYSGKPRYEHVLGIITANEFENAVKQNIINIAGSIKDAVRKDFYSAVDAQLNAFFKISSKHDQAVRGKK